MLRIYGIALFLGNHLKILENGLAPSSSTQEISLPRGWHRRSLELAYMLTLFRILFSRDLSFG